MYLYCRGGSIYIVYVYKLYICVCVCFYVCVYIKHNILGIENATYKTEFKQIA